MILAPSPPFSVTFGFLSRQTLPVQIQSVGFCLGVKHFGVVVFSLNIQVFFLLPLCYISFSSFTDLIIRQNGEKYPDVKLTVL